MTKIIIALGNGRWLPLQLVANVQVSAENGLSSIWNFPFWVKWSGLEMTLGSWQICQTVSLSHGSVVSSVAKCQVKIRKWERLCACHKPPKILMPLSSSAQACALIAKWLQFFCFVLFWYQGFKPRALNHQATSQPLIYFIRDKVALSCLGPH